MEEIGELAHGINKGKTGEVVDGIGDGRLINGPNLATDCIDAGRDDRAMEKGAMRDGSAWTGDALDDERERETPRHPQLRTA